MKQDILACEVSIEVEPMEGDYGIEDYTGAEIGGYVGGVVGGYTGKDDYGEYGDEYGIGDGYTGIGTEIGTETGAGVMANGFFVYGMIGLAVLVSVGLGILFAKIRIKKGFDPYED